MRVPGFYVPFAASPEGRRLTALCHANEAGFIASSRAGVPAVAALVPHLSEFEPWVRDHHLAKKFLGWLTGEIVKATGRVMLQEQAAVPGDIFVWGALWTAEPVTLASAA
ncbi:hypothetical protein [Roseococcus thiosulfatophilus]|uniref:hypothetical protein n=1 Tax=Roseococcus thiosulfatophilus TaxID=35813 RepID=UPI001A8ED9DC|nr:hypothetical protein [Roseococcus thiosulfatophilus]